jgi:phosphopantetheine--protein transferase-like protein
MGILGIGVDVVFVPRITSLISRRGAPRLASRILSVSELSDWNASPPANQNRFLAVRLVHSSHRVYYLYERVFNPVSFI